MRRCFLVFLLLASFLPLPSCCRETPRAAVLLSEYLGERGAYPAGVTYSTDPSEGEVLSEELIASLYARADGFCEYGACVEEAAVYLSSRLDTRFEMAVFLCYGSADTKAVSEMCLRRAALLGRFGEVEVEVECRGRAVYYRLTG